MKNPGLLFAAIGVILAGAAAVCYVFGYWDKLISAITSRIKQLFDKDVLIIEDDFFDVV